MRLLDRSATVQVLLLRLGPALGTPANAVPVPTRAVPAPATLSAVLSAPASPVGRATGCAPDAWPLAHELAGVRR